MDYGDRRRESFPPERPPQRRRADYGPPGPPDYWNDPRNYRPAGPWDYGPSGPDAYGRFDTPMDYPFPPAGPPPGGPRSVNGDWRPWDGGRENPIGRVDSPNVRQQRPNNLKIGAKGSGSGNAARDAGQMERWEPRAKKLGLDQDIYEQIGQVGEGTYAKVFKAKNRANGAIVAIKRLRMENERDAFPFTAIRESKFLTSLKHENILQVQETISIHPIDGELLAVNSVGCAVDAASTGIRQRPEFSMVFEYMDHDLAGLLHLKQHKFEEDQIKCMVLQMLKGLDFLHSKRILHRDIKAANILINEKLDLKLADFGLARYTRQLSHARAEPDCMTNRVVTLWYRSPELCMGSTNYGPEIDIWSVGCVMVEFYTFKAIFTGSDELSQLSAIWAICGTPDEQNYPDLSKLQWYKLLKPKDVLPRILRDKCQSWGLTEEACDLVDKLLAMDPRKRPTAHEAMKHPWFATRPRACSPHREVGIGRSWHEYESKQRRAGKAGPVTPEPPTAVPATDPPNRQQSGNPQDSFVTVREDWRSEGPGQEPGYPMNETRYQRRDNSRDTMSHLDHQYLPQNPPYDDAYRGYHAEEYMDIDQEPQRARRDYDSYQPNDRSRVVDERRFAAVEVAQTRSEDRLGSAADDRHYSPRDRGNGQIRASSRDRSPAFRDVQGRRVDNSAVDQRNGFEQTRHDIYRPNPDRIPGERQVSRDREKSRDQGLKTDQHRFREQEPSRNRNPSRDRARSRDRAGPISHAAVPFQATDFRDRGQASYGGQERILDDFRRDDRTPDSRREVRMSDTRRNEHLRDPEREDRLSDVRRERLPDLRQGDRLPDSRQGDRLRERWEGYSLEGGRRDYAERPEEPVAEPRRDNRVSQPRYDDRREGDRRPSGRDGRKAHDGPRTPDLNDRHMARSRTRSGSRTRDSKQRDLEADRSELRGRHSKERQSHEKRKRSQSRERTHRTRSRDRSPQSAKRRRKSPERDDGNRSFHVRTENTSMDRPDRVTEPPRMDAAPDSPLFYREPRCGSFGQTSNPQAAEKRRTEARGNEDRHYRPNNQRNDQPDRIQRGRDGVNGSDRGSPQRKGLHNISRRFSGAGQIGDTPGRGRLAAAEDQGRVLREPLAKFTSDEEPPYGNMSPSFQPTLTNLEPKTEDVNEVEMGATPAAVAPDDGPFPSESATPLGSVGLGISASTPAPPVEGVLEAVRDARDNVDVTIPLSPALAGTKQEDFGRSVDKNVSIGASEPSTRGLIPIVEDSATRTEKDGSRAPLASEANAARQQIDRDEDLDPVIDHSPLLPPRIHYPPPAAGRVRPTTEHRYTRRSQEFAEFSTPESAEGLVAEMAGGQSLERADEASQDRNPRPPDESPDPLVA